MGASCVLSLNSQLRRALSKGHIMTKLLRRSAILILLGLVLNSISSNNIFTLRIPGVLQRLGFTYIIVAVLELLFLDPEDNDRVTLAVLLFTWIVSLHVKAISLTCSIWNWLPRQLDGSIADKMLFFIFMRTSWLIRRGVCLRNTILPVLSNCCSKKQKISFKLLRWPFLVFFSMFCDLRWGGG